ncbi:MAG: family 2 glycosyl transferase [Parcubacteria group bacterium RIFOXYD2_FULL_52_8]|nr:MAG: family 2 glycosyl transferase [Parcubacteria group bacterium RIFOXYD2_FULL_52_8]
MKLSVIIPAWNEAEAIPDTLTATHQALVDAHIPHELLVVHDHSTDRTAEVLAELQKQIPTLRVVDNELGKGFGRAIRHGLHEFTGDCAAIMMADMSDDPADLVRYYQTMQRTGSDCVFGNRFMQGGKVYDYPQLKLLINRLGNTVVQALFLLPYNDCTNAFKLYSRKAVERMQPLRSNAFNLTLEMPLKAIVRGCSYQVVPNSWTNRKFGVSKFNLKKVFHEYGAVIGECLRERYFSTKKHA